MRYEWDERKRKVNLRKHGFDFLDAPRVFRGGTLTVPDDREDYEKDRHVRSAQGHCCGDRPHGGTKRDSDHFDAKGNKS